MNAAAKRLQSSDTALLVIDIQDRLLAKIFNRESLLKNSAFLLDVAKLLGVPIHATEQYPKGLGPTVQTISERILSPISAKTAFSCYAVPRLIETLRLSQKSSVVLVGIETHVCIMQTSLDLLNEGCKVFLPVDAMGSRCERDHDTAIRRLELAGAIPTTVETTAFEWVGDAEHPQFKSLSRLVIERSNS